MAARPSSTVLAVDPPITNLPVFLHTPLHVSPMVWYTPTGLPCSLCLQPDPTSGKDARNRRCLRTFSP